jgi:hypothetical protein
MSKNDMIILIVAAIALLLIAIQSSVFTNLNLEHFSTDVSSFGEIDIDSALQKFKKMDAEEDITDIQNRLMVYLTVFNNRSFNNMGRIWNNIAALKQDGTCENNDNSIYSFELAPVFNRKSGLYLGNNRCIGPYSNALNIQFHNTFTIVVVCKHGNLLVDDKNSEIELLKLYANSPNNNGVSLYIQKGSLKNDNNTQTGTLLFQYANHDPLVCKVDKDHGYINFDRDILTFYYIVKDTDNVRVLMMNENSNSIQQILKFTITNTDVTFSNKEMIINRLLNWNGNIFNFAIYDRSLSDEQVSNFYTHVMNEYLKNIDPNFMAMLSQYNEALGMIQSLTKCPYDKTVCDSCTSVKKWCDMNQVMTSTAQCKKAINDFCSNNTSHPLCKCWDTSSSLYNTESCRMYRSLYSGERTSCLEGLTAEDLEYIKNKYGLISPHECPTAIKKPDFIKNTYQKYDWNKLKVYMDPQDKTTGGDNKVRPMYPEDDVARSKAQLAQDDRRFDESADWQHRRIPDIQGAKSKSPTEPKVNETSAVASSSAVNKGPSLSVTNYFKQDPALNGKLSQTTAGKNTKEILDKAQEEQKNLLDSKGPRVYNIFNDPTLKGPTTQTTSSTRQSRIANPYKDAVENQEVSDSVTSTLPKNDSFFNRFMKVMIPQ